MFTDLSEVTVVLDVTTFKYFLRKFSEAIYIQVNVCTSLLSMTAGHLYSHLNLTCPVITTKMQNNIFNLPSKYILRRLRETRPSANDVGSSY